MATRGADGGAREDVWHAAEDAAAAAAAAVVVDDVGATEMTPARPLRAGRPFIRAINDKLERPNEIWRDLLPSAFISGGAPAAGRAASDVIDVTERHRPATNRRPSLEASP